MEKAQLENLKIIRKRILFPKVLAMLFCSALQENLKISNLLISDIKIEDRLADASKIIKRAVK